VSTDSSTAVSLRPVGRSDVLLACGIAGPPLFVGLSLVLASVRDGFDLRRHPFSLLSLGELGWVQIANFVVSGLLVLAFAAGLSRRLRGGPGDRTVPVAFAAMGASLIGGGVFTADPAFAFPPGTPDGSPATVSWHSALHGVAFGVGMLALVAATALLGSRFLRTGERRWGWYSLASGVVYLVLGGLGVATGDFRVVTVAIVVGWGWAAVVAAQLRRPFAQ
jgi:Protein of unknown function (DUF998)